MARIIVFTGGKGGVGKTTALCGAARSLAAMGKRVIIADFDLALANADLLLGLEEKVFFDIVDCVKRRCRVKQALVQDNEELSLYLLPSSAKGEEVKITLEEARSVVSELSSLCDYLLIDSPAGTEEGFVRAVSCADEAVVVCTPHLSSIRDVNKVLLTLSTFSLTSKYLLLNRADGFLMSRGAMLTPFEIFSLLKVKPLGILPEIAELNCGKIGGDSKVYFDIIADNLHNGKSVMVELLPKSKVRRIK